MSVPDFRKLEVWRKAHKLTLAIYSATKDFPKEEQYGLTTQLRNASSSIGAKIAEGLELGNAGDLKRSLNLALSFATELQQLLILARDLGFLHELIGKKLEMDVVEIKQMLIAYIKRLEQQP
jgi:four helix bundle protein